MKVIDLLNKIANGEEVPKKIKFEGVIYEYDKEQKDYIHKIGEWISETLLYKVMNCHFIKEILETEVKLIEDKVDIDNIDLDKIIKVFEDIEMCLKRLSVKISSTGQGTIDNYLDRYKYDLQAVKQLNKEIKSIKEK